MEKKGKTEIYTSPGDSFPNLLELAANNDLEGFKRLDLFDVDKAERWYVRRRGSNKITPAERTPLMVAATYGSIDVLKFILTLPDVDVNESYGRDMWTALHCAAFGGSDHSVTAVELLLSSGANPDAEDVYGLRPVDVVVDAPKFPAARANLQELFSRVFVVDSGSDSDDNDSLNVSSPVSWSSRNLTPDRRPGDRPPDRRPLYQPLYSLSDSLSDFSSDSETSLEAPKFSDQPTPDDIDSDLYIPYTSDKEDFETLYSLSDSLSDSSSDSETSLEAPKFSDQPTPADIDSDLCIPYTSDKEDFETFKPTRCVKPYSHDWITCSCYHDREDTRRRDPWELHYTCIRCPEFHRVGGCTRGDVCEYAHGLYESWLHPALFRSKLCKDGIGCPRKICGSAFCMRQLRPQLYNYYYRSGLPSATCCFRSGIPHSPSEHLDVPSPPHLRGSSFLSHPRSSSLWARRRILVERKTCDLIRP